MIEEIVNKYKNVNTVFYVLFTLLIIFMWKNPEITLMLFISVVFSSSLNPIVDKLSTKISRTLASSIVLSGFLVIIAVFLLPVFFLCAIQIGKFAVEFPSYISNINQLPLKYPILQNLGFSNLDFNEVFSSAANYSSDIIQAAMNFFGSIGSLSIYFFIILVFTFFLLSDKDNIKSTVLKLFPVNLRQKTEEIIDIINLRIGGYVVAQTLAILSVGVVMIFGLLIFKIPYAFLLGLITAILDIIPVVGPALALIIALVATYELGVKSLIIVTIIFFAAQFVENNFVRPYAFGKFLNIHPMLVFLFLFIGTKYFGIAGTLFAPALAAAICVLVEELYIKNLNQAGQNAARE